MHGLCRVPTGRNHRAPGSSRGTLTQQGLSHLGAVPTPATCLWSAGLWVNRAGPEARGPDGSCGPECLASQSPPCLAGTLRLLSSSLPGLHPALLHWLGCSLHPHLMPTACHRPPASSVCAPHVAVLGLPSPHLSPCWHSAAVCTGKPRVHRTIPSPADNLPLTDPQPPSSPRCPASPSGPGDLSLNDPATEGLALDLGGLRTCRRLWGVLSAQWTDSVSGARSLCVAVTEELFALLTISCSHPRDLSGTRCLPAE